MENCLVTKLKGVVNNDNLEKVNVFSFRINNEEGSLLFNKDISIGSNVPTQIGIRNAEDSLYSVNTTIGVRDNNVGNPFEFYAYDGKYYCGNLFPGLDNAIIDVSNKYSLHSINCGLVGYYNVNTLKYIQNLKELYIGEYVLGNISELPNSIEKLKSITGASYFNLVGTTDDIALKINLTDLYIKNGREIRGEIAKLGNLTHLNELSFTRTNIKGNLEDFVAMMVKNGVTTKSFTLAYPHSNALLKYNGISLPAESSITLSWEPSGNNTSITLGDVTTIITVNSDGTWVRVS